MRVAHLGVRLRRSTCWHRRPIPYQLLLRVRLTLVVGIGRCLQSNKICQISAILSVLQTVSIEHVYRLGSVTGSGTFPKRKSAARLSEPPLCCPTAPGQSLATTSTLEVSHLVSRLHPVPGLSRAPLQAPLLPNSLSFLLRNGAGVPISGNFGSWARPPISSLSCT